MFVCCIICMTGDLLRSHCAHTPSHWHASKTCVSCIGTGAHTNSHLSVPTLTGSHQQAIIKLLMTDLVCSHTHCLMLPDAILVSLPIVQFVVCCFQTGTHRSVDTVLSFSACLSSLARTKLHFVRFFFLCLFSNRMGGQTN